MTTVTLPLNDHYSIDSKRIYSDVWLELSCPKCEIHRVLEFKRSPLLYVPSEYPEVGFYCHECGHEAPLLHLEEIVEDENGDCEAIFTKKPGFGVVKIMHHVPVELASF